MAVQLSDLKKLMQEPSGEMRAEVAQKVASGFVEGAFNATEKQLAVEIFRLLLNDTEVQVRKMLSEQLSRSMDTPHDVVLKLAKDVTEVAISVLENSYVLTEEDLIEITQSTQDVEIMSTIARREMVSRELSGALLQKANTTVVETLLGNKSASIDAANLSTIYTTYNNNASVLQLMVKRGGLPVTLAEKLFVAVSDEMKKVLTQQYKLSMQVADSSTKNVRELATLGLVDASARTMDIAKLVRQLYQQGRLSLSMIIRSLCLGDMRFFEHSMAALADIPFVNAQLLILDQGDNGFKSLYKASCLPMEMFPAVQHILKIALEETNFGRYQHSDFRQRLARRLMTDNASHKIEYMDYLITLIQNSKNDVAAVY